MIYEKFKKNINNFGGDKWVVAFNMTLRYEHYLDELQNAEHEQQRNHAKMYLDWLEEDMEMMLCQLKGENNDD